MRNYNFGLVVCFASTGLFLSGCSDLIVTDVHYAPFTGQALKVKMMVRNDGLAGAQASTTQLEIKPAGSTSLIRSLTAPTPALTSSQQAEVFVVPLYPHEVPAPGSGQCLELIACADSTNAVSEISEGNNCKTNTICR